MNTLATKLTALATTLVMNSLIMGAVGFLFELQTHPQVASSRAAVRQIAGLVLLRSRRTVGCGKPTRARAQQGLRSATDVYVERDL